MQSMTAILMLDIVAKGLGQLVDRIVFVGGATMALYVDDPASSDPRPTEDVDCVVEMTSIQTFYALEEELRTLGFKNQLGSGMPICRWTYQGITVDVMPTDKKILGFTNSWYAPGIQDAQKVKLPSGLEVKIFTLAYFVASKFEAFLDRGGGDLRFSSDFEDIIFVLDSSLTAEEKLRKAPQDVRTYLTETYRKLAKNFDFNEAVAAHIGDPKSKQSRARRVTQIFQNIERQ